MKRDKKLLRVRALEMRLKAASPVQAGRLAKKLVKLKDAWINEP